MDNTSFLLSLENIDRDLSLAINSLHCEASDYFWVLMSDRSLWIPAYAVLLGVITWRLGWKRGLLMVAAIALCIVCIDQTANFFKELFSRLRPCNDPYMTSRGVHILEGISKGHCYGFFSGHAANSAGLSIAAWLTLRQDKRMAWKGFLKGGIIWSLLVGASRVFVAKHFLGDVLVGYMMGILIAAFVTCMMAKLYDKCLCDK